MQLNLLNDELAQAQQFVWLLHGKNQAQIQIAQLEDGKQVGSAVYWGNRVMDGLGEWIGKPDIYITLNVFRNYNRQATSLVGFNALYTDLDFYKIGITKQAARQEIQRMIDAKEVPTPSLIIDSGRGYQLVWLVDFMAATDGYKKLWQAMQNAIYSRFLHLNADNAAKSISQIYRLVGSRSSRTGSSITFEHLADRYTIGELKDGLLGEYESFTARTGEYQKPRKKRTFKESGLSPYTLAKARKQDLESLVELRQGRVNRRRMLFYYAVLTLETYCGDIKNLEAAIKALNNKFAKPLRECDLVGVRASAFNSYTLKQGNKNMGYKFTNTYLIENLEITVDEQKYMTQLIGATEKLRRKRIANEKARRAAGMKTKAEYNAQRSEAVQDNLTRLKAILDEQPDLNNVQLGKLLGVSSKTIQRLKKQF